MVSMRERLRQFATAWPLPLRDELNKYVHSHRIKLLSRRRETPPYWILLPTWLLRSYKPKPSRRDRKFLTDVLWGQFCLYFSVRIKDDLLDHDANVGPLVFAADLLQLEAMRTLSSHFPLRSAFWEIYFDSYRRTVEAIVRADNLQRTQRGSAETLLKEYTGSAIFKIGAAAVCFQFHGYEDYRHAALFCDEMSFASQLLDDLEDLDADWRRKRSNSIVRIMLGKGKHAFAGRTSSMRKVKRELLMGGFARILQMVLHRIDRAEQALVPIRGKASLPELRNYRSSIERMRRLLHRESVRLFFSGSPRTKK